MKELNDYFEYARLAKELIEAGRNIPTARWENPPQKTKDSAKNIMIFAPHPDDEVITGLLALRLMLENGYKVVNVAVSLGSNLARREGRTKELSDACKYLGWELEICGFDKVRPELKADNPAEWEKCVQAIVELIRKHKPTIVTAPHEEDANAAHIATGMMVRQALDLLGEEYKGVLVETEVWSGMQNPNILVEADENHLAYLMTALSLHVKEVERNDYHARLPDTFAEYVRRGAEVVGSSGGKAPNFNFGYIYAVKKFNGKIWEKTREPKFIACGVDVETILK